MIWRKKEFLVFSITLIVLAVFTQSYVPSGNPASRFATVESLVERGTFIIDNSTFMGDAKTYMIEGEPLPLMRRNNIVGINGTNDKVFISGHFYSDKPPVLSLLAAIPYFALYNLGFSFNQHGALVTYILTLLLIGFPVSIMSVYFYKFSRKQGLNENYSMLLAFALVFATLVFPYSITFNNHIVSGVLIFLSFYYLIYGKKGLHFYLSGLLIGFSAVIDIVAGSIFTFIFFLYLLYKKGERTYLYAYGLIIPFILHSTLNIPMTGDLLPGAMHPEYWNYPGSDFNQSTLTGFLKYTSLSKLILYGFHSLFGFRGLFSYTPLLFIALIFGFNQICKKKRFWVESVSILTGCLGIIGYYVIFSDNYGGWSYGMRWFVSFTPMIFIFLIFFLNERRDLRGFYVALTISFVFAVVGVYQPWTDMWYSQIPFLNNLKEILNNVIQI